MAYHDHVDDPLVQDRFACPVCGERRMDRLAWENTGDGPQARLRYGREYVVCESCGTAYDPGTRQVLAQLRVPWAEMEENDGG
ncbi:protein of unknown function [Candidatus Hydrogenisulfobacillus filiaventi]|uniref:Uncharacterized protein n=1 Tax=Candidatus Hydrogenisulfobacillus filiaventi TaxID=2707344 RepID=A0A6F8ZIM5_9FIRM|nr:protein of unknown function [Candidatus Hydrogenisulfobacillus filiaventi]